MNGILALSRMQEKKIGRGEDSEPILIQQSNAVVCGVFDGMGGAGSTECPSDYSRDGVDMTKAYIGSRIVRDAIYNGVVESDSAVVLRDDFEHLLKEIILKRYKEEVEKYPAKSKSGLRSVFIKEYPTTLAITCVYESTNGYTINSYWAGDSRNYLWTANGLYQISVDDLKGNLDPMENLHEDAPMSNCIYADGPFHIHRKSIYMEKEERFVVISATDGCFGYFPTPMDFEKALIDTLSKSKTISEWEHNLAEAISFVSADDFSFAIAAVGFKDFNNLRTLLSRRSRLLKDYFLQRDYYEKETRKLEEKITRLRKSIEGTVAGLWPLYKKSYLKYMNNNEER